MIDPQVFAQRQMELTAEFARYVLDHPEIDAELPDDSFIYFHVDGSLPASTWHPRQVAMFALAEGASW